MNQYDRRTALRLLGTGVVGAVAGCSGIAGDDADSAFGGRNGLESDSWPLLGNTPRNRTYAANADGPGTSPEVRWQWEWPAPDGDWVTRCFYSMPVADDGLAFTVVTGRAFPQDDSSSEDEEVVNDLVAVDITTGEREWSYRISEEQSNVLMPGAVGDGTVVIAREKLHAVDKDSGSRNWTTEVDGTARGIPTIAGDDVFVSSYTDEDGVAISAYNLADGSQRWTALDVASRYAPVAVTSDTVYAAAMEDVVALDRSGGDELWRTTAGTESFVTNRDQDTPVYTPVVGEDSVYVAGSYRAATQLDNGALVSLDRSDGSENWRFRPESEGRAEATGVYGLPVLHERTLFITGLRADHTENGGASGHKLYAVDADDGSVQWETSIELMTLFPVGAGERIYVTTNDHVAAYSTDDGSELAKASIPLEGGVNSFEGVGIVEDALLTRSFDGLVAFGPGD